jgi:hypothetical protein
VLTAIPASLPPARRPITSQDTLPELCEGAVITAGRLRQAAAEFTGQGRWSPQATSRSWRRAAQASAITGHSSEVILRTLTRRAAGLDLDPAIQAHLDNAARAMHHAWTAWRAVTSEWDHLSTGPGRGTGLSRAAAEIGDLVLRIGRIAYRNHEWTPSFGQISLTRDPAGLAPTAAGLRTVIGAVHHATDALTQIAVADRGCAHQALGEGRLYIARRSLPDDYDLPYRQVPAPRTRAQPLLEAYDLAVSTCAAATAALDDLAVAARAPTRALAAARRLIPSSQQPHGLPPGRWNPAQPAAPSSPAASSTPCATSRSATPASCCAPPPSTKPPAPSPPKPPRKDAEPRPPQTRQPGTHQETSPHPAAARPDDGHERTAESDVLLDLGTPLPVRRTAGKWVGLA